MKSAFFLSLFFALCISVNGQSDSSRSVILPEVEIQFFKRHYSYERLKEIEAGMITTGKRTQVISPGMGGEDLSGCQSRQLFSRVPGMMIWENDGSGLQMGVATRGLSPNRSWEFNVRQNGSDIVPDVFGYPESYYTPPMEAIDRIELIKGAASLQFGPQFGGLLNYKMKDGSGSDRFFYEGRQTGGTFGLINTYNAIGGQINTLRYYGFLHHRRADGWRQNSKYRTTSGYVSAQMEISDRWTLGGNLTISDYVSQQPGGIADSDLHTDTQSSARSRNWLGVPFRNVQVFVRGKLSASMTLDVKAFVNESERNSVGFMASLRVVDTIAASTGLYNARQVDCDEYLSGGTEARLMKRYSFWGNEHHLLAGLRGYQSKTFRNQKGVGSSGEGYDLTISGEYGKSFIYNSYNMAAFAENVFHFGRLSLAPGLRWERVTTKAEGKTISAASFQRNIVLGGIGAQYAFADVMLYGNASQSYRPATFSELTPSGTTEVIDPNLKDASGYSADVGFRGDAFSVMKFDVSGFYLRYENRIGTMLREGNNFRTNIGTSVSKGVELYVECDPLRWMNEKSRFGSLNVYAALTIQDCRYQSWEQTDPANPQSDYSGNQIENAPEQIHRIGMKYKVGKWEMDLRYSYTSSVFTDAMNTEVAANNGQIGKIPGYSLIDASLHYAFNSLGFAEIFVNNVADTRYATRRATSYPGPGLMPGMGRQLNLSLGLKI